MSNYFTPYFPSVNYKLNSNNPKSVVDITKGFIVRQIVRDKKAIYYDYPIQDGDRPDTIATKYYGDANLDWVVMIVNDIFDVNYDWPMDSYTFEKFIKSKYGSIAQAKSNVNRYEKILQSSSQDSFGNPIEERTVVVDKNTYDSLQLTERKQISDYQYEKELNEQKRNIKILDRIFLNQILSEAEEILE